MPRFALHPADVDEYDESEQVATLQRAAIDPRICVVCGLASDSGAVLNGRIGKVDVSSPEEIEACAPNDRLPVQLFDESHQLLPPKAIKRKNLQFATVCRETTGAGVCVVTNNPFGPSNLAFSRWGTDAGPSVAGISRLALEHMPFDTPDDLPVPLQFLLACGAAPNLERAQEALQRMADANCRALPMAMRGGSGSAALVLPLTSEAEADASRPEAAAAAADEEDEEGGGVRFERRV